MEKKEMWNPEIINSGIMEGVVKMGENENWLERRKSISDKGQNSG
jgi:hypothetical protein